MASCAELKWSVKVWGPMEQGEMSASTSSYKRYNPKHLQISCHDNQVGGLELPL